MSVSQILCENMISTQQVRSRSASVSSQLSVTLRSTKSTETTEEAFAADHVSQFPKEVTGSFVWSGADASAPIHHVIQLDGADVLEIENAVASFKAQELHGDKVSCETFPLSDNLSARLREASDAIHNKQGFCLLRGLEASKYSHEDNTLIYLGTASHIGNVRGIQDSNGNMLSHVTSAKAWESLPDRLRHGVHTNKSMPFHSDMGADILCLHYRQVAKEGGFIHLSSVSTIYNELAANYPNVLEVLATPNWPIQITKTRLRHFLASLISYHDGKVMASLDPGRLGRQQANPEHVPNKASTGAGSSLFRVPTLTQVQRDALAVFDQLAHKHKISVGAQAGDILFVNNLALVHARDAYTDEEAAGGQRRHAVRMWLHDEKLAWSRPAGMRAPWLAAFGYHFKPQGSMGDAAEDDNSARARRIVNRKYPIVPAADYRIPKYTAGSAAFVLDSSDDEAEYLDDDSDFE
ncbi:hypothetical protein PgNI_06600 [Pyricularia grisea]|uniref:TauD/TfdA-like domain-containing protein n=1 Tax=Pyricularia grisea TaxID=148305 RepID=A0A6P8B439_PYRGI|nr:hypothetical protein PgNI_06600 [Pyricularia grisea]TLD09904.1 hypothetical protein PgNI_06600 [Pyricularia grisea]